MRALSVGFLSLFMTAWLALPNAHAQERRVALVIGNAQYQNVSSLKNPVNDATDMTAALSGLGFAVTSLSNATADETRKALSAFKDKAKVAAISLVFYAGHAVEAGGVTFLVPVDGRAETLASITKDAVSLDQLLEAMAGVRDLAVVLLDSARNDPYPTEKPQPPTGTPQMPANVLIGYATRAGGKVADGAERNSPYTAALLKHIAAEGVPLQKVMIRVRDDVLTGTKRFQEPFVYGSFSEDVFLAPR